MPEMFFEQRFDVFPFQSSNTGSQPWQCKTLDFFGFDQLGKGLQRMIHIFNRCSPRLGSMAGSWLLSEEIQNSDATDPRPTPQLTWLWRERLAIVSEIFIHGRPALSERQGETAGKVVIRGHAVSHRFRPC